MDKKNNPIRMGWGIWFFLLGLGAVCAAAMDVQPNPQTRKMESSMNLASPTKEKIQAIPPIDKDAPAVVASASFGLG